MFYYFLYPYNLSFIFPHLEITSSRTKLLSSFFLNKNISILYTFSRRQHMPYLLYTSECFPYHFYMSQFLTLGTLTKPSDWTDTPAFSDCRPKDIFHTSRSIHFSQHNFSLMVHHVCLISPNLFSFPLGLMRRQK